MDDRRTAIETLALDRAAIDAVEALRSAGVHTILLKGRSFAEWLYADGEVRPYNDVDVLVPADRFDEARAVLGRRGYSRVLAPRHEPPHASVHVRGDGTHIDLHRSLQGLTAPPQHVWAVLWGHTEAARLGHTDVTVLDEVGRCLSVAIHAGRTDASGQRAGEDLRRALRVVDEATWQEAGQLAAAVGGTTAFAAGLSSDPAGAQLAGELALEIVAPGTGDLPRGTATLARLVDADSPADAVWEVMRWVVPTPALLRKLRPVARRGRCGLAIAYLTWPLWLLLKLVGAVRAALARRRS